MFTLLIQENEDIFVISEIKSKADQNGSIHGICLYIMEDRSSNLLSVEMKIRLKISLLR